MKERFQKNKQRQFWFLSPSLSYEGSGWLARCWSVSLLSLRQPRVNTNPLDSKQMWGFILSERHLTTTEQTRQ